MMTCLTSAIPCPPATIFQLLLASFVLSWKMGNDTSYYLTGFSIQADQEQTIIQNELQQVYSTGKTMCYNPIRIGDVSDTCSCTRSRGS